MDTNSRLDPVRALIDYSQNCAGPDDVMRSLVSHKGWLAPALMFVRSDGQNLALDHQMVLFGSETRLPPNELWIFTDRAAAERAEEAGALLGPYAADIAGAQLFGMLDERFQIVRVNPHSPSEQGWQFHPESYALARLWAQVISLEASIHNRGASFYQVFARFPAFLLFNGQTGYAITLPNQGGLKNPAVVFTAPDCADAFLARLTDEQRQDLQRVTVDGITLIKKLPLQQIDGLVLNVFGPGPSSELSFAEIEGVPSLEIGD